MNANYMRASVYMMLRVITLVLLLPVLVAHAETVHRGLGPEPDALDIHLAQGLSAINVLRDLNEGLITHAADGRLIAGVARSWTASEDGRTWIFELEPEARWSDGSPVTAADFVRGWHRALDPGTGSPVAGWLDPVAGARAIREGTAQAESLGIRALAPDRLEITLEAPTAWFEELLTLPVAFPRHSEGAERFNGPFVLVDRVPGAHLKLAANPHYRASDTVQIEGVVWHVIEDPSVELSRYRAGQLHITESIPPGRLEWLRQRFGDELRISPYLGSFFLAYNLFRPPFKDRPGLREALSLVIDRELIAERVIGAGELPAWRLVPPGMDGWPQAPGPGQDMDRDERLERARILYREAGYGPNNPLRVELRFNTSLTHRRMAAAVAAMWKQALGVESRLVNEEWKVFVTNRRHGRITEVVRGGWIADWSDPANFLQLFESDSPLNYTFFQDDEFDRHMRRARSGRDGERLEHLWQAEERLLAGHAIIPLYYYVSRHLVKPQVGGFEDNLMDIHLSRWMYLDE